MQQSVRSIKLRFRGKSGFEYFSYLVSKKRNYKMKKSYYALLCFFTVALLLFGFNLTAKAGDGDWKPIDPSELALKESKIEPGADAEGLFWEVYVSDEEFGGDYQTVLRHYLRLKVFNERGREQFSKIDIPFGKINGIKYDVRITDIAARTTKPDGSSIELKKRRHF